MSILAEFANVERCLSQTHGTVGAASKNPVANHKRVAAARRE